MGDYEWACFAAQQGAEKAIKAVYQRWGGAAWGHSLTLLLEQLPTASPPSDAVLEAARRLDKHYIPARYPNGFEAGAPLDYYTRAEAEESIRYAETILRFCEDLLAGPVGGVG